MQIQGKDWTRFKFECLDSACEDKAVLPGAFRLLYRLCSAYLNRERGYAFPSQETMAADLGCDVRSVQRYITNLIETGHLEVRLVKGPRLGGHRHSEYRPLVKNTTGESSTGESTRLSCREYTTPVSGVDDSFVGSRRQDCRPNPCTNPGREPLEDSKKNLSWMYRQTLSKTQISHRSHGTLRT
jgi:hypothetical protein